MSASRARTAALAATVTLAVSAALLQAAQAPARSAPSARAAGAPTVLTMIVGRGGAVLSGARRVSASATTLTVAGRSCAVAAATPLAALAATRRAGGPGFAVRDYGHCGSSPADSGQLFVYSLGGQRNSGQSGWEYKVGGAAGSTGAGDESGPSGNGRRIRGGERVLWFWCYAGSGGCQRTLEVSGPASVSSSHEFVATVYGYDNEGRGRPVSGAQVTLAGARATTGGRGQATLRAPGSRGRFQLSASRSGMAPPFPVTITVR
jgi:hypothetical protein